MNTDQITEGWSNKNWVHMLLYFLHCNNVLWFLFCETTSRWKQQQVTLYNKNTTGKARLHKIQT